MTAITDMIDDWMRTKLNDEVRQLKRVKSATQFTNIKRYHDYIKMISMDLINQNILI